MKKMHKKILIETGIIFIIAIALFCILKYFKTRNSNESMVMTYVSHDLGVQFNYLNDGGSGSNFKVTPIEQGNKIILNLFINGKQDSYNTDYLTIFKGSGNESVEHILMSSDSEVFQNKNCSVVAYPQNSNHSYLIWDKRIPTSYFRSTTLDGSPYQSLQNPCLVNFEYYTDPAFPGIVYTMAYPTQAESFYADLSHTKMWYQTIQLISK